MFNLICTYLIKDLDNRKNAIFTCDGLMKANHVMVLDRTYANCICHEGSQLFYAISAIENLVIFGGDVSNVFSEADIPKQTL